MRRRDDPLEPARGRGGVPRRTFLASAAAMSAVGTLVPVTPQRLRAAPLVGGGHVDPAYIIEDPAVRALALRALDAAKAAGAGYADVRLTRVLTQQYGGSLHLVDHDAGSAFAGENEFRGVGVRALVNGVWGFAASPYWDANEVVQLAREATRQAQANGAGAPGAAGWAPIPVATGSWRPAGVVDPFAISIEEKIDLLRGWCSRAPAVRRGGSGNHVGATFWRQERAVATSEGGYFTQTQYSSSGAVTMTLDTMRSEQQVGRADAEGLGQTAAGWELFLEADIPGQIPRLLDEAESSLKGPRVKPGDVGKYDVVLDAATMAALLAGTLGPATQLDRAMGLEANASGTSFLGPDPLAYLGRRQVASPLVTVTANRSIPRGLATVKWDDEGVEPEDFTLVKDGVLADYQTTREQAIWLAAYYQKAGKPVRSHGCAAADDALSVTLQHAPNLVLESGTSDVSFTDLVCDTRRGLAVTGGGAKMDFQGRTGLGGGAIREIVNGQLGAQVAGLAFAFETTDLWKSIVTLGGARSAGQFAASDPKGQPVQPTAYSIRAVPAKLTNLAFIDPARKA